MALFKGRPSKVANIEPKKLVSSAECRKRCLLNSLIGDCSLGRDKFTTVGVSVGISALFSPLLFLLVLGYSTSIVVLVEDLLVDLSEHTLLKKTKEVPSLV